MSDFSDVNEDFRKLCVRTRQLDPGQWLGSMFDAEESDASEEDAHEEWSDRVRMISETILEELERLLVPGGLYRYTRLTWETQEPSPYHEPILLIFSGETEVDDPTMEHYPVNFWPKIFQFVTEQGSRWTMSWSDYDEHDMEEITETLYSENNMCFTGIDLFERIG